MITCAFDVLACALLLLLHTCIIAVTYRMPHVDAMYRFLNQVNGRIRCVFGQLLFAPRPEEIDHDDQMIQFKRVVVDVKLHVCLALSFSSLSLFSLSLPLSYFDLLR